MPRGPEQMYQIDIDASVERVWQFLVNPDLTQRYYFGTRVESDWRVGSPIRYRNASNGVDVEGEILEISPPQLLATTFQPRFTDLPPSNVTWEIAARDGGSRVNLTHAQFDTSRPGSEMITRAWDPTLVALKNAVQQNEKPNAAQGGKTSSDVGEESDTQQT